MAYKSDLFGLNSSRKLLNIDNSSNGLCTLPVTLPYDDGKFQTSPYTYAYVTSSPKRMYSAVNNKYLQLHPAILKQQILDTWTDSAAFTKVIPESYQLDKPTLVHQPAASVYDATCTWNGVLPFRSTEKPASYSNKVFLGGVPWDITEESLVYAFKQFGLIHIEWPAKVKGGLRPKGYVHIVFKSEKDVKALLKVCIYDYNNGKFYYIISSKLIKGKRIQVIPWIINDSSYIKTSGKLDISKTVFVRALHGGLNAEGLAKIMNDLFDGVVYADINTAKYKYPIGSGHVVFNNIQSFKKAVDATTIEVKTPTFSKKIRVDPYLEDTLCSICGVQQGLYFCRDLCFQYFCSTCWQWQHSSVYH